MLKFQPRYYVVYSLFFFSNKDFANTYMLWQVIEAQGDELYKGRFCSKSEMGQTDVAFTACPGAEGLWNLREVTIEERKWCCCCCPYLGQHKCQCRARPNKDFKKTTVLLSFVHWTSGPQEIKIPSGIPCWVVVRDCLFVFWLPRPEIIAPKVY